MAHVRGGVDIGNGDKIKSTRSEVTKCYHLSIGRQDFVIIQYPIHNFCRASAIGVCKVATLISSEKNVLTIISPYTIVNDDTVIFGWVDAIDFELRKISPIGV